MSSNEVDIKEMEIAYEAMFQAALDTGVSWNAIIFAASSIIAAITKEGCGNDIEKQEHNIRAIDKHIRDTLTLNKMRIPQ